MNNFGVPNYRSLVSVWTLRAMFLSLGLVTGLVLVAGSTGCSEEKKTGGEVFTSECFLPNDQIGSLVGRWPILEVPLAVQEGTFSSAEMDEFSAAIDTWNTFYQKSRGYKLFLDLTTSVRPNPSRAACGDALIQGNRYTGPVVFYKVARNWPYAAEAIAITNRCSTQELPLPRNNMAITELNYQNFFVSGKRLPDLQSIILHELGHVLGVGHSCEQKTTRGVIMCNDPNISRDYVTAVMYPVVPFPDGVNGEVKRSLQLNDQQRANCLYVDR